MKKLIATALAVVLVASFVFAGYSAQAIPSVKTAVDSSDLREVEMNEFGTEVLSTQIKVSGEPKDLVIAVTAECALVTNVKLTGKKDETDESSSRATITVKVLVDDVVVAEPGEVVFADRLMRVRGKLNETEWFEIYMKTRNANGFNFIAKDVGTGVHTITVVATRTGITEGDTGSEDTLSLIGKRTLVVNEVNLK